MYNNRLNQCGQQTCCNTRQQSSSKNTTSKSEPTINNVSCGDKKVISISKVKDTVVIMLDDCSYITAPSYLVDKSVYADIIEEYSKISDDKLQLLTTMSDQVQEALNEIRQLHSELVTFKSVFGEDILKAHNP